MLFEIVTAIQGAACVVAARGELDVATGPELGAAMSALPPDVSTVVIDLSALDLLDSSGARALAVAARARQEGGATVLVVCPPSNRSVSWVLDFLGVNSLIPVLPELPAELLGPGESTEGAAGGARGHGIA